jgi:endonuclease/exonuclease/phosphatase family metal-dependent hydrolase
MRWRPLTVLSATVAGIGMVAVPLTNADAAVSPERGGTSLTVMTRNLYLGADVNRPMVAALTAEAEGGTAQDIVVALAHAARATRDVVDQTDFDVRSRLIAREVAEAQPDVIGLQEVALWRSGPLDLARVGVPAATHVDYDYLQILLDDLAARGLHYEAVQVGDRADVESPCFEGSPFDGTMADGRNVRLTMRDVILVRADDALRLACVGDTVYDHNLAVTVAGTTLRFDRGFHWVDLDLDGGSGSTPVRFVNTHLEAFSSDVALAQAAELLAAAPSPARTTVVACDGNSDPLNRSVGPADQVPHNAPYELITGTGGFTDQWLRWASAEDGWTCGLSELVNDPTPAGFDHRIDMVFARTPAGTGLPVDRGQVTGTDLADRDPATGLWPSDHGGVVLELRVP